MPSGASRATSRCRSSSTASSTASSTSTTTSPSDYAEYVDFLKTVGQLLAGALGKARLLERLEESNNELRELVDSGLEFGSSLELEEVLYSVAGRMRGLADAEECEIVGLERPDLVVRICVGPRRAPRRRGRRPPAHRRPPGGPARHRDAPAGRRLRRRRRRRSGPPGARPLPRVGPPGEHPPAADRAAARSSAWWRCSTATPASSRACRSCRGWLRSPPRPWPTPGCWTRPSTAPTCCASSSSSAP